MTIKQYIVSLMKDERNGAIAAVIKVLLVVISWFYGASVKAVDWSYNSGIRKQHKADVPVISVGNITTGGTGKTPFSMFLAEHLLASGMRPGILTRGYGGDESRMLSDELDDVPVFVGQDRVKSARIAVREGCDILVMDDGFQHRRLARDLNIVLFDSSSPLGNGHLLPRGVLRENISSLKRADIAVLTKVDEVLGDDLDAVKKQISGLMSGKKIVTTRHKPFFLSDIVGAAFDLESISNKRTLLVSGIVDPDYFEFLVKGIGADVVSRCDYGDHHNYTQYDMAKIEKKCLQEKIDKIVVTKKDFVKIKDLNIGRIEEKLFVLNIVTEIVEGKENLIAGFNSIVVNNRG